MMHVSEASARAQIWWIHRRPPGWGQRRTCSPSPPPSHPPCSSFPMYWMLRRKGTQRLKPPYLDTCTWSGLLGGILFLS